MCETFRTADPDGGMVITLNRTCTGPIVGGIAAVEEPSAFENSRESGSEYHAFPSLEY